MAFGKKNNDVATADADADEAPEIDDVSDEASQLESVASDVAPAATDADAEAPTQPPPAAAPAASNSDALLTMFQSTESESEDLTILADLAGETDIDDLLEELRTIRAAFGITDAFEEDLAAA